MIRYSIIIPVFDNKECLIFCLEAIKGQINKETEIIIIDDGSKEASIDKIAKRYTSEFIKLKKNGGAGSARNCGVKIAKGEWLIFIDADVLIPKSFFTKLIKKIKNLPQRSCLQGVYNLNTPIKNICSQYKNLYYYYNFFYRICSKDFYYLSSHCFIIPKKIFHSVGGFNIKIKTVIEDADLSFRLLKKNYQIILDRKLTVLHLKNFSLFNLLLNDGKLSFAKAKHILRNFFKNNKDKLIIVSGGKINEMYPIILNVLISPLILLSIAFMFLWKKNMIIVFILFLALFLFLNFRFFLFIKNKKTWVFLIKIIPLYFLDMFSAFIGVFLGIIDFILLRNEY